MGILLKDLIQGDVRALGIVAVTSIVFALLLWAADARAQRRGDALGLETLGFTGALFIGCAQALALIPGTSRSGVTLTAARILGLRRESAAKFSFLLSIPIILASGLLLTVDAAVDEPSFDWGLLAYAAFASALVAFASIHFFMRLLPRVGVLPFVIYRLLFGAALLLWLS
jgi:undecaprenyl-diphosphatase